MGLAAKAAPRRELPPWELSACRLSCHHICHKAPIPEFAEEKKVASIIANGDTLQGTKCEGQWRLLQGFNHCHCAISQYKRILGIIAEPSLPVIGKSVNGFEYLRIQIAVLTGPFQTIGPINCPGLKFGSGRQIGIRDRLAITNELHQADPEPFE